MDKQFSYILAASLAATVFSAIYYSPRNIVQSQQNVETLTKDDALKQGSFLSYLQFLDKHNIPHLPQDRLIETFVQRTSQIKHNGTV